jgi:hypothetical protein
VSSVGDVTDGDLDMRLIAMNRKELRASAFFH